MYHVVQSERKKEGGKEGRRGKRGRERETDYQQ